MDYDAAFAELRGKAEALGIEVRVEPFFRNSKSAGGLIKLHGRLVALINHKVVPSERLGALEGAVADAERAVGASSDATAAAE